jgi:FeS assembly SUF system protein
MFSFFNKRSKHEDAPAPVATVDAPSIPAASETPPAPTPLASPQPSPSPETHGLNIGALTEPAAIATPAAAFGPIDPDRTDVLKPALVDAISTVFDPEIPVNIYELGLIYEIAADTGSHVHVQMTLTSPACPSAQQLPSEVRYKCKAVPGVSDCTVDVVWEPPWTKDMMSEAAKLSLGMF